VYWRGAACWLLERRDATFGLMKAIGGIHSRIVPDFLARRRARICGRRPLGTSWELRFRMDGGRAFRRDAIVARPECYPLVVALMVALAGALPAAVAGPGGAPAKSCGENDAAGTSGAVEQALPGTSARSTRFSFDVGRGRMDRHMGSSGSRKTTLIKHPRRAGSSHIGHCARNGLEIGALREDELTRYRVEKIGFVSSRSLGAVPYGIENVMLAQFFTSINR